MDTYNGKRYTTNYDWEQKRARNNRLLGFVLGVAFVLLGAIMYINIYGLCIVLWKLY